MIINVLEYLEEAAKKYPQKIAFSDSSGQISYNELLIQTKTIGSYLIEQFNGTVNQGVVVFVDRSIKSLIMFLGILYSGNYYVPIDEKLPQHRIKLMLDTLNPKAILFANKSDCISAVTEGNFQILYVDNIDIGNVNEAKLIEIRDQALDTDPLCVFFTSGSTGVPKGVIINHRSVAWLTDIFTETFGFSTSSVFGNQASLDFSVSLKDIYLTLKNGATLHIIPQELFSFPLQLINFLDERQINTAIWVTSALRVIANLGGLDKNPPKYLKKILFSGEVMPNKILNYWRRKMTEAQFVNLYGQSEIAYNCTYFIVDRPFNDEDPLPAGKTFRNNTVMIINKKGNPVKKGELGEIYIKGVCLGIGYYNNPAETKKAFCQNPLNPFFPEIVFKTGDIGTFNDHNELLFVNRQDHQIKHMGHRIELGEVEVAANSLDCVDAACCLYDQKTEKIVLFYQAPNKIDGELLQRLRTLLPRYMLPNKMVYFNRLPMNKNAKIDRVRLWELYKDGAS